MPETRRNVHERDKDEAHKLRIQDVVELNDTWYRVQTITKKDIVLRLLKDWELPR